MCKNALTMCGAILIAGPFLTGCVTGSSDPSVTFPAPPVIEYTIETQRQVANELDELQAAGECATCRLIDDYGRTRDALRELRR